MSLALLVFARALGFCARAPGLVHPSIPALVRVGIAAALALALAAPPAGRALSPMPPVAYAIALAIEFGIGSAIGIGCSLLYDAAYVAGRLLDDYVGVHAIAPSVALVAPSGFGRLWSLAFTGAFFLLAAYRPAIAAFAESLHRLPPGAPFPIERAFPFVLWYVRNIVALSLQIAAPAIATAFTVQLALAAVARTIPRFVNYALAFPLAFGAVTVVTALTLALTAMRAGVPVLPPGLQP